MKAIKVLVIGMGVLIILGLGLVGYGLYRNTHAPASTTARGGGSTVPFHALPEPSAAAGGGYFASELPVPAGTSLTQVLTAGDRVILHFSGTAGEGDRLLMLDPQTGQVAGSVTLVPEQRSGERPPAQRPSAQRP